MIDVTVPLNPERIGKKQGAFPVQGYPCALCGQSVNYPHYWVYVAGLAHIGTKEEVEAAGERIDLFPICPACETVHAELRLYLFERAYVEHVEVGVEKQFPVENLKPRAHTHKLYAITFPVDHISVTQDTIAGAHTERTFANGVKLVIKKAYGEWWAHLEGVGAEGRRITYV